MTQDQIMKLVDAYAMAQYNQAFCDRYDEERRSAARAAVVAAIEVQVQEIARIRELWEADQIESSEQRTQIHQLRAQVEVLTKDAARYRFVNDLACQVGRDSESIIRLIGNHKHLDALIDDSRMAKAAQKGQA